MTIEKGEYIKWDLDKETNVVVVVEVVEVVEVDSEVVDLNNGKCTKQRAQTAVQNVMSLSNQRKEDLYIVGIATRIIESSKIYTKDF